MRFIFILIFTFIAIFSGQILASGDVIVENRDTGIFDTVVTIVDGGVIKVGIKSLVKFINPKSVFEFENGKLSIFTTLDTIKFYEGNNFYRNNDKTYQLMIAPVKKDLDLIADISEIYSFIGKLINNPVTWDRETRVIVIDRNEAAAVSDETIGAPVIESIRTIVIDPGHGGKDPGAIGQNSVKEKDVVLAVGLFLRDLLKNSSGIKIFMTRDTDVFIPLRERTRFANKNGADLFISIHANSVAGNKKRKDAVRGYKMYFLSQSKNEDDKRAARIENSVIELEKKENSGSFLENIINDMANNEYLTESQAMSIKLTESFGEEITQSRKLHTGIGQANFWVLNGAFMPAVLIETGFISNSKEEKLLASKKYQKSLAGSICEAILRFKKSYEAAK